MTRRALLPSLLLATLLAAAPLRAEEGEWTDLLPDNNLSKYWTTTGNWSANDEGVVTLTPREGEKGWTRYDAYLWLEGEYENFEFQFDYMVQPRGNSGFYFHVGDRKEPVAKGIEVQIYDSGSKGPDARLTDHDSGGVIPGVPPTKNAAKPAGEWNSFHIIVKDRQLTVKLNGETVNAMKLGEGRLAGRPEKGSIGFQDHGLPLSLRNLKVKKL